MTNEAFAKNIKAKLDEALNYGVQNTPVTSLSFPDDVNDQIPQNIVTNGETTPIDAPREDLAAQKQGGDINSEVLSEINSLLVTIGFILSKESIIPDKYNIPAVLDFLSTHFKQVDATCVNTAPIAQPTDVTGIDQKMLLAYANPVVNSFMESRIQYNKSLKVIK